MKSILTIFFAMIISTQDSNAHSIHSRANYYGATHSALIKAKSYRQYKELGDVNRIETPYLVEAETIEVFYGDVPEIFEYIYWGFPGDDPESRGIIDKPALLSFCSSDKGIYYMYENFAHIPATRENIKDFSKMSKADNSEMDDHQCKSNFPQYNPDNYKTIK